MRHLLLTLACLFPLFAQAGPLAVGTMAPAVTAPNQDGQLVNFLSAYDGGLTLICFYSKSGTPGCIAQTGSLRDSYDKLTARGIRVIAVSHDTVETQKKFAEKNRLPFPVIADANGKVADAFNVDLIPILNFTKRISFLVKDGRIVWVAPNAETSKHAEEVLLAAGRFQGKGLARK